MSACSSLAAARESQSYPQDPPVIAKDVDQTKIVHEVAKARLATEPPSLSNPARKTLIELGIRPSPAEASEKFWSLGEDWWKQIIDGSQHEHGPMVFDEGLHGHRKEPGYLDGIHRASLHATEHLEQELDKNLYTQIHHIATSHFDGINTLGTAEQVRKFRSEIEWCNILDGSQSLTVLDEERLHHIRLKMQYDKGNPTSRLKAIWLATYQPDVDTKDDCLIKQMLDHRLQLNESNQRIVLEKEAVKLSTIFDKLTKKYSLGSRFVSSEVVPTVDKPLVPVALKVVYRKPESPDQLEHLTKQMIADFNSKIAELQQTTEKEAEDIKEISASDHRYDALTNLRSKYQEAVLPLIATLYAELEWLHPWIDGQGRTDLVMLSYLLCREGLHPCILKDPYYSTTHSIDEWTQYLQKGLDIYEIKREYNHILSF